MHTLFTGVRHLYALSPFTLLSPRLGPLVLRKTLYPQVDPERFLLEFPRSSSWKCYASEIFGERVRKLPFGYVYFGPQIPGFVSLVQSLRTMYHWRWVPFTTGTDSGWRSELFNAAWRRRVTCAFRHSLIWRWAHVRHSILDQTTGRPFSFYVVTMSFHFE